MTDLIVLLGAAMNAAAIVVAATITVRGQRAIRGAVSQVHDQVKTFNGKTIGELGEIGEGQRIMDNVPPEQRTPNEREYVLKARDSAR